MLTSDKQLVSCIVPFYNAEQTIVDCLDSIVRIDHSKLEVILVNDGSTDKSMVLALNYIEEIKAKNISFHLFENKINSGISSAKNLGMSKMSGEFFFFAGVDDLQKKERISKPLYFFHQYPSTDIVYFDCTISSDSENFSKQRKFPKEMNQENSILFQLKRNHFWSGLFLARNTINEKFDEEISSAVDYDWYFNLFFNHRKINFIRESFLDYKIHENNTSRNLSNSLLNVRKILKKYNFDILKKQLLDKFDHNDVNLSFAWTEITLGKYHKAIDLLNTIKSKALYLETSFLLGSCYAQLNNYDHAHSYFAELVLKFPNSADCLNNLAVSKFFHANFNKQECILLFKKALEINPRYTDARQNLLNCQREEYQSLKITTKPLRETLIHS